MFSGHQSDPAESTFSVKRRPSAAQWKIAVVKAGKGVSVTALHG